MTVYRTKPIAADPGIFGPQVPAILAALEQRRSGAFEYAKEALEALVSDASVGAEARIRLGYLHRVRGNDDQALAAERVAADAANDPDLKYVANFIAAQSAQALGDLAAAETHYRAALNARPHSQSATLGLAALLIFAAKAGRRTTSSTPPAQGGRATMIPGVCSCTVTSRN